VVEVLEDEIDWPHRSAWTGFVNNTSYPSSSLYKYMVDRNHCNHRDYQNIGVNGCRSGALENNVILSFARNQTDKPALIFFELVGNDVCTVRSIACLHTLTFVRDIQLLKHLLLLNSLKQMS
jgi:acyloxyacyl hydrolase